MYKSLSGRVKAAVLPDPLFLIKSDFYTNLKLKALILDSQSKQQNPILPTDFHVFAVVKE